MKKRRKSRIGTVLSRMINIRAWADWDRTRSFTTYLVDGFKRFFVPQNPAVEESFDEAMVRLNISDQDLKIKKKSLFRLSVLMLVVAAVIFLYLAYQLIFGSFKAAIVSFIVLLIALVLAFRYHFWYFQIKNRKLGCTVQEWYRQGLKGEKE